MARAVASTVSARQHGDAVCADRAAGLPQTIDPHPQARAQIGTAARAVGATANLAIVGQDDTDVDAARLILD